MSASTDRRLTLLTRLVGGLRAAATHDVFPEFSAKVRRFVYHPLGVLSLAATVSLLCGLFLHTQGFVLFGSVVAVLALGITWPWLSLWGLRGLISFARGRAVEGEQVEACLTLCNRLPWATYGLAVRGGLAEQTTPAEPDQPSISIAYAPRRRSVRCRWSFTPIRRGVYPLSTPLLTTGFPFGLWEKKRALAVETPLLVWPRTYPVGPVPMVSGDQQIEGNVSRSKVGSNGDVLGVRPYRRGDSPRRIHWGQSARHDRLIVCELQANARPVVQLVLDVDSSTHIGHGSDSSREWAIRIVASLAKGWLSAGVEVGGVWNRQAIPAASGLKQVNALLDSLAKLPDASVGPSLSETLASPVCRNFSNGLQVIVTTDLSMKRAEVFGPVDDQQHWLVLQTQGFVGSGTQPAAKPTRLPIRPWLLIDSPEHVASLLRGGWKEAQHGP
jgi:uncharacterized protein (DUF58 family)